MIKTCLLSLFFICCMACSNNKFDIDKANWVAVNNIPFITYTIKDSVSLANGNAGKLDFEFYGWEKKGTIVSAYSNDDMNNFIELIKGELTNNNSFKQLAKTSNGFIKFDVDKYMKTANVFESGIPIFKFAVK